MKETGRKAVRVIPNLILMIFSITCVYPAIWLLYSSLKDKAEFYNNPVALPSHPSFQHYIDIFTKSKILVWMGNTVRNSAISLVFIIMIGLLQDIFYPGTGLKGENSYTDIFFLGCLSRYMR